VAKRVKGRLEASWAFIYAVLVILVLAGLGYFAWVVFFAPQTIT
jgi:flagellar basal body-associated protein FliL